MSPLSRKSLSRRSRHPDLYLLNFVLLFTHEIDSAYWHEWELFGLPGGIQLFLALHVALGSAALLGYRWVLAGERRGYWLSLILASAGLFAFAVHTALIAEGHPEFRLPVSVALLAAILAASLAQGAVAVSDLRRGP